MGGSINLHLCISIFYFEILILASFVLHQNGILLHVLLLSKALNDMPFWARKTDKNDCLLTFMSACCIAAASGEVWDPLNNSFHFDASHYKHLERHFFWHMICKFDLIVLIWLDLMKYKLSKYLHKIGNVI